VLTQYDKKKREEIEVKLVNCSTIKYIDPERDRAVNRQKLPDVVDRRFNFHPPVIRHIVTAVIYTLNPVDNFVSS
jgi:hypothetical protein